MQTPPKQHQVGWDGREELERWLQVLSEQAERLIRDLGVNVSDAETFSRLSSSFRLAANAYERLAMARRRTDQVKWERTTADGRNGTEIMSGLWKVREELRGQNEATTPQENSSH